MVFNKNTGKKFFWFVLTVITGCLLLFVFPKLGIIANSDSQLGVNMFPFLKSGFYVWLDLVNGGSRFVFPSVGNSFFQYLFNLLGLTYTNGGITVIFFLLFYLVIYKLFVFILKAENRWERIIISIFSLNVIANRLILNNLIANISVLWSLLFSYLGLWLFLQYYESGNKIKLILSVTSATLVLVDIHSGIIMFCLIGLYVVYDIFLTNKQVSVWRTYKQKVKRTLTYLLVTIVLNLYWLIIYLFDATKNNFTLPEFAFVFSSIDSVKEYVNTVYNFLSYNIIFTRPGWYESVVDNQILVPYEISAVYFFIILAFVGVFFLKNEKNTRKKRYLLYILLSTVILYSLSFGPKNPLGIFDVLWNYLPGFRIFRDFFKFQRWLILFVNILSAYSLIKISSRLKHYKIIVIILLVLFSIKAQPYYSFRNYFKPYRIPSDYQSLASFTKDNKLISGIQVFPTISWMQQYTWSNKYYDMTDPIGYYIPPMMAYYNKVVYQEDYQQKLNMKTVNYLLNGEDDLVAKLAAFRNIGYLLVRNDLSPTYVKKAVDNGGFYYNSTSYSDRLKTSQYWSPFVDYGQLSLYQINPQYFTPLIFSTGLIYTNQKSDHLEELMRLPTYRIGDAIYFGGDMGIVKGFSSDKLAGEYAKDLLIYANLNNEIIDEDINSFLNPVEYAFTAQDFYWKPFTPLYKLNLLRERIDLKRLANKPEAEFNKHLYYASKRIAEVQHLSTYVEINRFLEPLLKNYQEENDNALAVLTKIVSLSPAKLSSLLAQLRGQISRQQEKIFQLNLTKSNREKAISIFDQIINKVNTIKPLDDISQLSYSFNIPVDGKYEMYLYDKATWNYFGDNYYNQGIHRLILPYGHFGENILDETMRIVDYEPETIFRMIINYTATKQGLISVTEGGKEELFRKILPPTGNNYKEYEIFFKSSVNAEKGTLFLLVDGLNDARVEKVIQPNIVFRLLKTETELYPGIEFKKINPVKYRVVVHQATKPFPVVFSQQFHSGWNIYLKKATTTEYTSNQSTIVNNNYISTLFHGSIQNDNLPNGTIWETWGGVFSRGRTTEIGKEAHLMVNTHTNAWLLNPEKLCQATRDYISLCTKNPDGSYDIELIIEFWSQRIYYFGLLVSGITILLLIYVMARHLTPKALKG